MKQKSRWQFSKRLLSFLLVALLALTPVVSQTTIYAANEDEASQTEAADTPIDDADKSDTVSVSSADETQEISDSSKSETEDKKEESDENNQTQEETGDVSSETSADTNEDSKSQDADAEADNKISEQSDSEGDAIEAQDVADSEIYGNVSDYAGVWKESNYVAGTYTVTANLSMPGQYNPVLKGVTVYANNPNNPFGPVLDPNDPAENVQNSAPTTPLTSNATLNVSADGTLTLTLPIKNPIFTTQKLGTSSNLAFTAEKLAGSYTYGANSVDSRIYKLTATLGKTELSESNVATYIFKGSELYALPLGLSLKPTGDVALQLDVDLSSIPVKTPSDTDTWTKKVITDEATGITMTASTDPDDGMFKYGEEKLRFMAADASAEDTSFTKMYAVAPYFYNQIIPTWAISTSWYLWVQDKCQFDFTVPASSSDSLFYLVETDTDGNKNLTKLDAVIKDGKASFTLLPKTMTETEAKDLLTKLYAAAYNYNASEPNSSYDSAAKAYIAETTERVVSPNVASLTYNGKEQTGVKESAFYTVKEGTVKATKAGTYKATLELSADAKAQGFSWKDNEGDTLEVTWQIKQKELEVCVNYWRDPGKNVKKENLEDFAKDNISAIKGFVDGEDEENASGYVAPVMNMPEGYENLQPGDSFDISFTEGKADNYYFTYPTTTFHILNPCLDDPTPAELTYNGEDQNPFDTKYCWSDSTKVDGERVELDSARQKDVGKYKSELGITGYPTEVFKNGTRNSGIIEWEIKPAVLTVTYKSETVNANGTPQLELEVTGFVNGETAETAEDYVAPTITAPENLEAGEVYTLTPEGGSAKNYIFRYVSGDLTVEKEKELKPGTYTITSNLTIKGENNQVLEGVQIYPGVCTFPPVVGRENAAKLVVKENGDKYITISFRPNDGSEEVLSDASEIFTLQALGDGEKVKVTDTKRDAGPEAPYGEHADRIIEATFKVEGYDSIYALGECTEYPTLMDSDMHMPIHLLVDWDSAVRSYVEPEEDQTSWTKTYTDEATGVSVTVSTTEKTVGEKLEKAVFTVNKEADEENLNTIKEALEPNYNGNITFGIYTINLEDAEENKITLDGNTKAELSFTTEATSTDLYRKKGLSTMEAVELKNATADGKAVYTIAEKLGSFVLVDSGEAYRWFTKTFTDSQTDINTTLNMTNYSSNPESVFGAISYSTKVDTRENGDKEYSFGYGSPLEPLFGANPVSVWTQGQTVVTMDVAAEEGTNFYLVVKSGELSQVKKLNATIENGRATVEVAPLNMTEDGNTYLNGLYYNIKDDSGDYTTAYILATKDEVKYASAPINLEESVTYTGLPQSAYIDGENYEVVSGEKEAVNAGSHTLTVKPAEGYTWDDGSTDEKTLTWYIGRAYLTVSAENEVYLTNPGVVPEVKTSVTGFVNGETAETAAGYVGPEEALKKSLTEGWDKDRFEKSGQCLSNVYLTSGCSADNYYFMSGKNEKITIYTRMTQWPDHMQEGIVNTYNGRYQYDGIYNNSSVYVRTGETDEKEVGSYTETVSLSEEYVAAGGTWPDGTTESFELTWKIKPAELTATYAGETIDADGTPSLNIEVTGFVKDETAETAADYVAPTVTAPESLEAGKSYELTPEGGSAKNYTFNYVAGTLSVNAKEEPTPEPTPVDPTDELKPGTYQITANVYLPGELNTQLQGVTAYMTNPDNPVGIGGHTGIPNTPVSDNAKLVVGNDGSRTIVVDLVNPVFTLQKISSGSNIEVLAAQRDNETYSGNTGISRNGRITTLYLKLKDNSGTYQFGDCTEFPTLLETDWNVPLRLGVDFASAKKLSDSTEVKLPDNGGNQDPTPTAAPVPTSQPDGGNNSNNNNSGSNNGGNTDGNTVTKLKPGTYTVTANIWFNKADTGLPMNPHITSSVFPPKDPVTNNATLVVDSNNHAYVTVPIAIQSKVMTVRSISGLNITDMTKNSDGAITSITIDLGILENPDAVITKSCNIDIWMGELAMSISGFSKEHSWPATFQINLSGVATESGSPSADGIMGNGGLTNGVATGDSTPVVPYVLVLAAAASVIILAIKKKRSSK